MSSIDPFCVFIIVNIIQIYKAQLARLFVTFALTLFTAVVAAAVTTAVVATTAGSYLQQLPQHKW